MHFLADVHLICEVCHAKRFKEEVLEVQYNGKNIHEVLELSVHEAMDFFKTEKDLVSRLRLVVEHNTDVIKRADWLIELGPEAGEAGGNLVFEGRPSELNSSSKSVISNFLYL